MTKKNYAKCLERYRDMMAEETFIFLKSIPGFKTIPDSRLKSLSYVLNFYKLPVGSKLWKEGEPITASQVTVTL